MKSLIHAVTAVLTAAPAFAYQANGFGAQQVITTQAVFPHGVQAADLDGDGDNDVLSASMDNKVAWYENLGGGSFGGQQQLRG